MAKKAQKKWPLEKGAIFTTPVPAGKGHLLKVLCAAFTSSPTLKGDFTRNM